MSKIPGFAICKALTTLSMEPSDKNCMTDLILDSFGQYRLGSQRLSDIPRVIHGPR